MAKKDEKPPRKRKLKNEPPLKLKGEFGDFITDLMQTKKSVKK